MADRTDEAGGFRLGDGWNLIPSNIGRLSSMKRWVKPKDLKRRAPGTALGLATVRFGDWARSFLGCDRMSHSVPSSRRPCTDSRMSNGPESLPKPRKRFAIRPIQPPQPIIDAVSQCPVARRVGRARPGAARSDEFFALDRGLPDQFTAIHPAWVKAPTGWDWYAIHGRMRAQVALLQSPILTPATPQ